MKDNDSKSPPGFNLFGGALFTSAGLAMVLNGTFSHFTWGDFEGGNIRIAGGIGAAMGTYLLYGYLSSVRCHVKTCSVPLFLFCIALISWFVLPFLKDYWGFKTIWQVNVLHLALVLAAGRYLHNQLTTKERPTR